MIRIRRLLQKFTDSPRSFVGLGLLITFLLIGVPTAFVIHHQTKLTNSIQMVSHTLEVQKQIQSLWSDLLEAQSDQRGFIITSLSDYLDKYKLSLQQVAEDQHGLQLLTADNPVQQENLKQLASLIHVRVDMMDETISLQKKGDHGEVLKFFGTQRGNHAMAAVRETLNQLDQEEQRLLVLRQKTETSQALHNAVLLDFLVVFDSLCLLGMLYLLYRLSESLAFNQKIITGSTEGMLVFDTTGRCVSANEAAARILGLPIRKMLQQNFPELAFWQNSGIPEIAQEVLQTRASRRFETRKLDDLGAETWLNYDLTSFTNAGRTHLLVLINDLTLFRQAEQVLTKARTEAENASRVKSEFLANMSHEIRTPMNAIIGLSHLALDLELSDKLRDYLTKIHSSSQALLAIINDILDFSKMEAGRLELVQEEFSLEAILETVSTLFMIRAEEKGLEMVFDVKPNVPLHLIGDGPRLSQILNNLVGNAVKFTHRGEIILRIETIDRAPEHSTLRIAIRDTGIGIDPEQISRLFQPFVQADSSINRRFGGTGLGLVISQQLVEKMGGTITVESQPDHGSCFSFTVRFGISPTEKAARFAADLHPMRVLVVDDLEPSRFLLRELLSSWHFEVVEAASGPEALRLLERAWETQRGFDVLLIDWKMPEMDGLEVVRKTRAMLQEKGIPQMPVIVMVTAHSRERLQIEGSELNLDVILTKPVLVSGLFDTFVRLQRRKVYHGQAASTPVPEKIPPNIRGARILVVEDNPINQQVAREFLEREGFKVFIANNGRQCLAAVEQHVFDLVLMDLHMPEMDGFEATRALRLEARYAQLPIVAMTAAAMEKDRTACLAAGMNDHLAKPIDHRDLTRILIKWIKPTQQTLSEEVKAPR